MQEKFMARLKQLSCQILLGILFSIITPCTASAQYALMSNVYGVVTNESGEPLIGVNISVESSQKLLETISGKDGSYKLESLVIGSYILKASHPNYESFEEEFVISAGTPILKNIQLTNESSEAREFRDADQSTMTDVGKPLYETESITTRKSPKTIKGRVLDENGYPIPFASVAIRNTTVGTTTNEDGLFTLHLKGINNPKELLIKCLGYEEEIIEIKQLSTSSLSIKLKSSNTSIKEVVVNEKSTITLKSEVPYAIGVIDAVPLKSRNIDISQLLNTSSGVKVRETGGLGSDFTFTLTGFSGNQIKFFIDGIPMDYFGSSLSFNNFPVSLISSVEVYQGVIPIEFGSDALGGAVNLVTNQNAKSFVDASYSYGSFNTHRASVISQHTDSKTGLQVKANVFYNYSDNNYKIWVDNVDAETSSVDGQVKVTRFHDAYESKTGQVEVGFVNKAFADKLLVGVIASTNYDEIQNGYNLNKTIGEAYEREERVVYSLKYAKKDLFIKKLDARLFATYINGISQTVDTSSHVYDWYGNYTTRTLGSTAGEFTWFKTKYKYTDKSTTNSLNLSYDLWPGHQIMLNNTYSYLNRSGDDPMGYYATLFIETNKLKKNVSGLSYNLNLFEDRFKSMVFAKYFYMNAGMYDYDDNDDLTSASTTYNYKGVGIALSYFIIPELQFKASFENTNRLPETIEIFGNGLGVKPNAALKPEQSKNLNFGAAWHKHFGNQNISINGSYLYRDAQDFIKMATSGNLSKYENYTDAKINCYEADIKYNYNNKLRFNLNGTYQDIINNNKTSNLYGDRIPNVPYLFANANVGYQFTPFTNKTNKVSVDWNTNYVEEFYLKSPSQGSSQSKYVIPTQLCHNVSLSFILLDGKYNISLACTNLSDSDLYDNFKLQKPGRAFSAKLRYFISKN